jgi:hypothetical protein
VGAPSTSQISPICGHLLPEIKEGGTVEHMEPLLPGVLWVTGQTELYADPQRRRNHLLVVYFLKSRKYCSILHILLISRC